MNRLDTIASRQRNTRLRDALFIVLVVIAGAVSLSSLHTAASAATPEVAQHAR